MAAIQFFAKVVRTILWNAQMVGDELDEATRERVRQREEYLSWKMTRLLQELEQGTRELEQRTQEQSGLAWGAPLFAALQQWQFWAVAGVLLLLLPLFGLCWWLRKRSRQPASSSKEASCRKKADEVEQKAKDYLAVDIGTKWAKRFRELDEVFRTVEEFIRISQKQGGKGNYHAMTEASHWMTLSTACLLMPPKPHRGHTFHLELGTAGEMAARNSSFHVELERTCTRERLVEDTLCCRTERAGHGKHAPQLAVEIAAAAFLHSKSIRCGVGPDAAEGAIARSLATEKPATRWTVTALPL
ncbi:uncharacterized protein LOC121233792 [Aquila chrysaetos chrysaetos]|uniref:uncharacterized protein LOC121233792 n=1 Tax=Aquila chrysaetos chrysaetos TaxID=223781 RepID=UPI001B7D43AB|nr:uncharacterized protein LOC121233792 [Aquila chrysaetos chrysaetos]